MSSIWNPQDRYILANGAVSANAPLSGDGSNSQPLGLDLKTDNSLSGNGTLTSPLGVVPGYNETVLWSGVSSISANPHCPVSESPKKFEYVSIFCRGYPTHQPQLVTQIDFNGGASENQAWIVVPAGGANGAAVRFNQFACSANDNEVYSYSARQFSLQGATASTATSPAQITKIVGINRKQ